MVGNVWMRKKNDKLTDTVKDVSSLKRLLIMLSCFLMVITMLGCAEPQLSEVEVERGTGSGEIEDSSPLVVLSWEEDIPLYAKYALKEYGVDVMIDRSGNEADEQMLVDFASGRATYDVIDISNALGYLNTPNHFIDRGYFLEITDVPFVQEAVNMMHPVLQEYVMREERIYALPHAMRMKVLYYDAERYESLCENLGVTELSGNRAYETWTSLMDALEGNPMTYTEMDWQCAENAMLEQYALQISNEGMSFDCEEFIQVLERMKRAWALSHGDSSVNTFGVLGVRIGSTVSYQQNNDGTYSRWCYEIYPTPLIEGKGKHPANAVCLAINAFTEKPEAAKAFVSMAANIGLNGKPDYAGGTIEGDNRQYGGLGTASCYVDTEHVIASVGDEAENQKRWLEICNECEMIPDCGFLTAFYVEIYPMYLDGAISAQQCAKMTQERYEMYRLEQE